jgi:hypothetical protein
LSFVSKKSRKTPALNNSLIFPSPAGFCYYGDGALYSNPYNRAKLNEGFDPSLRFKKEGRAGVYYYLLIKFSWLYFLKLISVFLASILLSIIDREREVNGPP